MTDLMRQRYVDMVLLIWKLMNKTDTSAPEDKAHDVSGSMVSEVHFSHVVQRAFLCE